MRRATETRTHEEINRQIEFLGTQLGISIDEDYFGIAVDIQHHHDLIVFKYRQDNFRSRCRTAGYVARKLFNIRYNNRLFTLPRRSAYTFTKVDAGAGNRSLKRTQDKLAVFYKIKSDPEKTERLFQDSRNICEVRDHVGLVEAPE